MRTGWVYRSDAPPAAAGPVAATELPAPAAPPWVVIGGNGRTPRPRVERRVEPRVEPCPAPTARPERGWIETGLYVMTLPMAVTVGIMLAPIVWMFGGRSRQ